MKHIQFPARKTEITDIQLMSDAIAFEAVSLTDLVNTASTAIPRFAAKTREFFLDVKTRLGFTASKIHNPSAFVRHLQKLGYANASVLEITVPEGFNANLREYSEILEDCTDHTNGLLNGVLKPYCEFLGSLVGQDESLKIAHEQLLFLSRIEERRKILSSRADLCFTSGSNATRRKMGSVVDRLADWDGVFIKLQAIDASLKNQDLKKIDDTINQITELLEVLQEKSKKGGINSIHPSQLKTLSAATLIAAREVEFMAVSRHRITVFTSAMEENIRFIEEIVN